MSADHLKDYQIDYVLIGHHERRRLNNETQDIVAQKVKEAEECQLNIIYCCGEEKADREQDEQEKVICE